MAKAAKFIVLSLVFLIQISVTFGEVQITLPDNDYYNLGDKIKPEVSVKLDEARSGIFSIHVICADYSLQYYAVPLEVESGFRTQIDAPFLSLSSPMLGQCFLRADFGSVEWQIIDSKDSTDFFVEKQLNINLNNELLVKPGAELPISGQVTKYDGSPLETGNAIINFGNNKYKFEVIAGKFGHAISVPASMEAGIFPLLFKVSDEHGNYDEQAFDIEILAIPSRIENQISLSKLMPGDKLSAKVTLFDHTNKILGNKTINVKVIGPNGQTIAQKDIQSTEYFEFATEVSQEPGTYSVLSSFNEVKEQSNFVVETVKKIEMKQDGGMVFVRNMGNVKYNEEITILLESDEKKYALNKVINLKPKEQMIIDLSKEVPEGNYEVTLPVSATEDGNASEKNANVSETVFSNVSIEDNRNTLKKTTDGLSAISGFVVGTVGYVASKPILATGILVLIIVATVLHYSWGYIRNKATGKKKDSTENLFKDYKPEEGYKKE